VDAGTYKNDFITVNKKLTIIGVGGMVNLVATVPCPDHKAIMTVQQDLTLKNFSFTGATVSAQDGGNGAGIRYEGGHLVLYNDAFYNNQNGLMGGAGDPAPPARSTSTTPCSPATAAGRATPTTSTWARSTRSM
jgi:hypothetical protein